MNEHAYSELKEKEGHRTQGENGAVPCGSIKFLDTSASKPNHETGLKKIHSFSTPVFETLK